jgi:hypothetical protein
MMVIEREQAMPRLLEYYDLVLRFNVVEHEMRGTVLERLLDLFQTVFAEELYGAFVSATVDLRRLRPALEAIKDADPSADLRMKADSVLIEVLGCINSFFREGLGLWHGLAPRKRKKHRRQ